MKVHLILYVTNQKESACFYSQVLGMKPVLDVPGMTEFHLNSGAVLGLMPYEGIRKLLGTGLPDPAGAGGAAKCELYMWVDDPAAYHARALNAGARELSPPLLRDWGHEAAYSLDPDGHVLAFAKESPGGKTSDDPVEP